LEDNAERWPFIAVFLFTFSLSVLFISGCRNTGKKHIAPTAVNSPLVTETDTVQEKLKSEDYERIWPGKKKLIWLSDNDTLYSSSKATLIEFNNTLLASGANFVVEFVNKDSGDAQGYYDLIRQMKREGQQVDLLNTGAGSDQVDINTYPAAVRDGLLEPLDNYLHTDKGKVLYDSVLPASWDTVTLNHHIYGIHPMPTAFANLYLFINKSMQDKYRIKLPEQISSLTELKSALKTVSEAYKDDKKFVPLYIWLRSSKEITDYDFLSSGIAVRHTEEAPVAFNPLAEPEVQHLLQALADYKEHNYVKEGQALDEVNKGNFFAFVSYAYPSTYHAGKLQVNITDPVTDVSAHVLRMGMNIQAPNGINGVASWSANKEEAFQLLTLVNTNRELSNLLRHGVKSGKPEFGNMQELMRGAASPSNKLITAPIGLETDNKLQEYREYAAGIRMSPAAGFKLNEKGMEEDLAKIGEIYGKYEGLWSGTEANPETQISTANQELTAAHIDRILAQVNKQLEEWWKTAQSAKP